STDHTPDIARELARQYPQLRLVRHTQPRGAAATVETGMAWAKSELVLVQEDPAALSATELRRLWSLRERPPTSRPAQRQSGIFDAELLDRLSTWGQALKHLAAGRRSDSLQVVRRENSTGETARPDQGQ